MTTLSTQVQAALDAPVGADRGGEALGVEFRRREIISPLAREDAVSFDSAFGHADHRKMRETRFVGIATVREQPVDLVTDDVPALLEAAMIAVRRLMRNGDDLVRLLVHGLQSEHETLAGGPGGDEMQRLAAP